MGTCKREANRKFEVYEKLTRDPKYHNVYQFTHEHNKTKYKNKYEKWDPHPTFRPIKLCHLSLTYTVNLKTLKTKNTHEIGKREISQKKKKNSFSFAIVLNSLVQFPNEFLSSRTQLVVFDLRFALSMRKIEAFSNLSSLYFLGFGTDSSTGRWWRPVLQPADFMRMKVFGLIARFHGFKEVGSWVKHLVRGSFLVLIRALFS